MNYFPEGFGGYSGGRLATAKKLYTKKTVRYVHSVTGTNATNAGRYRSRPYASLAYAISQQTDATLFILMDGHTENVTASIEYDYAHMVIGEGSNDGVPGAELVLAADSTFCFVPKTSNIYVENVLFRVDDSSSSAITSALVADDGTTEVFGLYFVDCRFVINERIPASAIAGVYLSNYIRSATFIRCAFAADAIDESNVVAPFIRGYGATGGQIIRMIDCSADMSGCAGHDTGQRSIICTAGSGDTVYMDIRNVSLSHGATILVGERCLAKITVAYSDEGGSVLFHESINATVFPNGIEGTKGYISGQFYTSGNVFFVDSEKGSDGPGYGADFDNPYASLGYAFQQSSPGDTIVLSSTHDETVSSMVLVDEPFITIVGCEDDDGNKSTVTSAVSGSISVASLEKAFGMMNVKFVNNQVHVGCHLTIEEGSLGSLIDGCDFFCKSNMTNAVTLLDAIDTRFFDCKFHSVDNENTCGSPILVASLNLTDAFLVVSEECEFICGKKGFNGNNGSVISVLTAYALVRVFGITIDGDADIITFGNECFVHAMDIGQNSHVRLN